MGRAGDSLILTAKYNAELVPESGAAGEGPSVARPYQLASRITPSTRGAPNMARLEKGWTYWTWASSKRLFPKAESVQ